MPNTKLPNFTPIVHNLNKSTMTVSIGMDKRSISEIEKRTQDYKSIPNKLRPAMEEIANYFTSTMIPRVFKQEGPGWRHLAKRTVRERQAAGYPGQHPILRRSGDLMAELTERGHPKHIEVITVGRKARIQIGGSSKKFIENQLGKSETHLPARPMIPGTGNIRIQDRDKQEMSKILEKAYKRALGRP